MSGRRYYRIFHSLALIAGLSAGGSAIADTAAETAGYVGTWRIADDLDNRQCRLGLRSDPTPVGLRIEGLEACRATFPVLANVAAWRPNGDVGVVLVDTMGELVADYAVGESAALLSVVPSHVFQRLYRIAGDNTVTAAIATHGPVAPPADLDRQPPEHRSITRDHPAVLPTSP